MIENYSKIQQFINELSTLIEKKSKLKLILSTYTHLDNKFKMLDAVLLNGEESLAIFEFKSRGNTVELRDIFEAYVPIEISLKFLVVTNGSIHHVLNRRSNKIDVFENTEELLTFLITIPSNAEIETKKKDIAEGIERIVNLYFTSFDIKHPLQSKKEIIMQMFKNEIILKHLLYDKNGQFYHFSRDIRDLNNFENTFFKILIDEVHNGEIIYRYTTLETVFATIDKKSLRLNGIPGMNDISEIGYVETYLDEDFVPFKTINDVDQLNKRFILCSSTLKDDLLQWRLYGDDCKGACLVFSLKDQKNIPGLQIRKINYGIEVNEENFHPELELIANIIDFVKSNLNESFQFRALSIWKHFFKSFEYAPEKEVRLLLVLNQHNNLKGEDSNNLHSINKTWCLTTSHKIANPFITIELRDKDLPIELTEIILGAKCPEILTNEMQFSQLLKERNMAGVDVKISRIKNYR